MNAEILQNELAEITAMDLLAQEPALSALKARCKEEGFPQTMSVLRAARDSLRRTLEDEDVIDSAEPFMDALDDKYFALTLGGKFRVGYWESSGDGREELQLSARHDFLAIVENITVPTTRGVEPVGPIWLADPKRPQYLNGMGMYPHGDAPEGVLNLWRGFGVEAVAADHQIILDHICDVVCDGDKVLAEYMLNWIALKIQEPTRVMGVMPVFISKQGAGKGAIYGDLMLRIFGQHGVQITSSRQLVGQFNKHLADACYVYADECFFVGDKAATQKLKGIVTEKFLQIEPKGIDQKTARSYLGIIAATNVAHAVEVTVDDRRILPAQCSAERIGDHEYFGRLFKNIHGDGAGGFLAAMLARDVSAFDPARDRPVTDEMMEQRELSLSGVHRWWQEHVDDGVFPTRRIDGGEAWGEGPRSVSRREMRLAYQAWARENAGEQFSDNKMKMFWNRLHEIADFVRETHGDSNDRHNVFEGLTAQQDKLDRFLEGPDR